MTSLSVATTEDVERGLWEHLVRADGQEDVCLATYTISSGARRTTHLLDQVHLPRSGERRVHGNATIAGKYIFRIAGIAKSTGRGVAILHSHPSGRGWQGLSSPDFDAESGFARLVEDVTGLPLVGLTLAGDRTWSARAWVAGEPQWAESVRTVGPSLRVNWNDRQVPVNVNSELQERTISSWGDKIHADITRLRILVVGVGSVGLDVVQRLAATGIQDIGVMDVDHVESLNLDRMIGATRRDARLQRPKVDVAARLAQRSATAKEFVFTRHKMNLCTEEGVATALDYDVIFSCVDRPLPRSVLNTIAYADLVPVIDGGIAIDTFEHGGMRGATRRMQVATPGRPCLACSGQLPAADVALDASGDLDDPEYIRRAGREPQAGRPNVAVLAAGVSSCQLDQFVSLVARPAGRGVPAPLRFILATHTLVHTDAVPALYCPTERDTAVGNNRDVISMSATTAPHSASRSDRHTSWITRLVDRRIERIENRLT